MIPDIDLPADPHSPAAAEQARLSHALGSLDEAIDVLWARLRPVISPHSVADPECLAVARTEGAPLTDALHDYADHTERLISSVSRLMDRLEV